MFYFKAFKKEKNYLYDIKNNDDMTQKNVSQKLKE